MSKYNRHLKIAIANQCLSGESSEALSRMYDISSRQIRYWAQVVTIHGNNAFQPTPHLRCAKVKPATNTKFYCELPLKMGGLPRRSMMIYLPL